MRKALLIFAIVFAIAIAGSAMAQTPNIVVYFDEGTTEASANCPSDPIGTVVDTLYVVANNFDMWLAAVEFQIIYPSQIDIIAEQYTTDTVIGNSVNGISLAWPTPLNAYESAVMMTVRFFWDCSGCAGNQDAEIVVGPNPNQGLLRALRWPDNFSVDVVGMTSLICTLIPVEETTWGQVKALYN